MNPSPEAPPLTQLEISIRRAGEILRPLAGLGADVAAEALGARADLFSAACLKIVPKGGGSMVPLAFNPIQMDYLRCLRARYAVVAGIDRFRGIRDAIVKPRQLGFSTMIAALFFHDGLRNPGRVTVVLAHDKDIAEILLETYRAFFEHLPPEIKAGITLKSDSKYEFVLCFPGDQAISPPSKFIIDTEAGHPWRGGRIDNLHASEAAFYKDFGKMMASYAQGVPIDGDILLETTANGQNDYFHLVQKALDHRSPYSVIYYPWWAHPEYLIPWPAGEAPTGEETALMVREGLSLQQIAWRRGKQQDLGDLFLQEYPETLLGAFLSTGRPFFDAKIVAARHKEAVDRLKATPPETPRAHVTIWENPVAGEQYLITGDVAEGKDSGTTDITDPERGGTDFCSARIIKVRTLQCVGSIHGRITPVEFARLLMGAGRLYNWAVLAVERNNHGHSVVATLEAAAYPQTYRHLEYDAGGTISYLRPGWPTDVKTRPLMLDALDTAIRSGSWLDPDPDFWRECSTFQRGPTGKPEALPNCHDDRVISSSIGAYLCTLGRNAWGCDPAPGADAAGYRTGPAPLTVTPEGVASVLAGAVPAAVPAAPRPVRPAAPPDPLSTDPWAIIAQTKATLLATTCASCVAFSGGACSVHRFSCKSTDPSCPMHYPASAAEGIPSMAPVDGEVSW